MIHRIEQKTDDTLVVESERELKVIELDEPYDHQWTTSGSKYPVSGLSYDAEEDCGYVPPQHIQRSYSNNCWGQGCNGTVSSKKDVMCAACGYYICSSCGRCKGDCEGLDPAGLAQEAVSRARKLAEEFDELTNTRKNVLIAQLKVIKRDCSNHFSVLSALGEERCSSKLWANYRKAKELGSQYKELIGQYKEKAKAQKQAKESQA